MNKEKKHIIPDRIFNPSKRQMSILRDYMNCKSIYMTACKNRITVKLLKRLLKNQSIDLFHEFCVSRPRTRESLQIDADIRNGMNLKKVAEKYFRSLPAIYDRKRSILKRDRQMAERKFWLKQYGLTEAEITEWNKTGRSDTTDWR